MIGSEHPKHARVVPPEMQELLAAHHPQPALVTHASWFVNKVHSVQHSPLHTRSTSLPHSVVIALHILSQNWHPGSTVHAPQLVNVLQYASVRKAVSLIW